VIRQLIANTHHPDFRIEQRINQASTQPPLSTIIMNIITAAVSTFEVYLLENEILRVESELTSVADRVMEVQGELEDNKHNLAFKKRLNNSSHRAQHHLDPHYELVRKIDLEEIGVNRADLLLLGGLELDLGKERKALLFQLQQKKKSESEIYTSS
jgi:hypothetical protein